MVHIDVQSKTLSLRHWENGFPQTAKGLNYAALPRATTNYFPRQNPKINLGEWQENLRVISPGGVSPLRLIPGSLLLEDDTSPSSSTERREGTGGEAPESNMRQHRNVPNIRRSSSSPFPMPRTTSVPRVQKTSVAVSARGERHQICSLWWQSFPSGKHRLAEMDRESPTHIRKMLRRLVLIAEKKRKNDSAYIKKHQKKKLYSTITDI